MMKAQNQTLKWFSLHCEWNKVKDGVIDILGVEELEVGFGLVELGILRNWGGSRISTEPLTWFCYPIEDEVWEN